MSTKPTLADKYSIETFFIHLQSVLVSVVEVGTLLMIHTLDEVCVPNKAKNINVKAFNLMPGVNELRFLVQHESCACKCGLNERVCNSKQKWNHGDGVSV